MNTCYNLDCETLDKLRKKVICEFNHLLCLIEKGHRPDYQFILEEISLIWSIDNGLFNLQDYIFVIQFYLNNKWQIETF